MSAQLPPIPDSALQWQALRAPGPGGQHVNKVATAVQLRVDLAKTGLPPAVQRRLARLAGRQVNRAAVLIIEAKRFRSQARNRNDAWSRFQTLLAKALVKPKVRIASAVPAGQKRRRLEAKRKRAGIKQSRRRAGPDTQA